MISQIISGKAVSECINSDRPYGYDFLVEIGQTNIQ